MNIKKAIAIKGLIVACVIVILSVTFILVVFRKQNGPVRKYYESGELLFETMYKKGKQDGLFKRYYKSGQLLFEASYENDKIEGLAKKYYENGQLQEEVT